NPVSTAIDKAEHRNPMSMTVDKTEHRNPVSTTVDKTEHRNPVISMKCIQQTRFYRAHHPTFHGSIINFPLSKLRIFGL
ncbi:unnamed protein product, partial [Prunus brigantina]